MFISNIRHINVDINGEVSLDCFADTSEELNIIIGKEDIETIIKNNDIIDKFYKEPDYSDYFCERLDCDKRLWD